MQVREIMTKNPACCVPQASLQEVAKMMVENDCGCIPVVGNWETLQPLGAITDRDITVRVLAEEKNPLDLKAEDIMTSDIITVAPETSVDECYKTMADHQIRRVLVVDENNTCCGIVAQADVAQHGSVNQTAKVVKEISDATSLIPSFLKTENGNSGLGSGVLLALPVGVSLGVALMYFLDPEQGRRRRALINDQVMSLTNKAQKSLSKTGKEFTAEAGKKLDDKLKQKTNQTRAEK